MAAGEWLACVMAMLVAEDKPKPDKKTSVRQKRAEQMARAQARKRPPDMPRQNNRDAEEDDIAALLLFD